jgi:glutathione S-transferase/translation elongation factor EF-1beta
MKLHYSTEGATNSRYRKIKSVINALKIEVAEVAHDTTADLSKISLFNTLPLLETPEGTFFSSNTIIRYLAASNGNKLYGGDNLYHRALVDQWLDITTCDFETAVAAVAILKDGREANAATILADIHKFLGFVEKHLTAAKFLVGDSATLADYSLASGLAVVLAALGDEERKAYPHLTAWYLSLVETDATIGGKEFPKESHKALKAKKEKHDKHEKKEEKKAEKKDDDFDPFADDAEEAPKAKKEAPVVAPKKEKKKVIAKSIITFDVKVYEEEYDLDALWEKIQKEVVIDGLVWNQNPKKIPVVGKIFKLQVGCVVEDDKVATDDIFDRITAWEDDVQSIDIVSFNKL